MKEIYLRKIKAYEHIKDNKYCFRCARKRLAFYRQKLSELEEKEKTQNSSECIIQ